MNSQLQRQNRDYRTQEIDEHLLQDLRFLVRLAIKEDLDRTADLTTLGLVPADATGSAAIISRVSGIAAGFDLIPVMIEEMDADIQCKLHCPDKSRFQPRQSLATLSGSTRDLLTCERTILNFLGRLCGIATQADQYQQRIEHTRARLYDTRKTTPGWRRLEKYATHCGGARNHRMGLFDGILIKDNHLACRAEYTGQKLRADEAVRVAREFLQSKPYPDLEATIVEVEVDSIEQLKLALSETPDIVLLDNMTILQLEEAVATRNEMAPQVELEASGGVNLETIARIAETGVDRISVGALTHSAVNLDLGLDWQFAR